MATRTTETNVKKTTKPPLRKLNAAIIKMKVGDKVDGYYRGKTSGPWVDKATGEEKELTRLHFSTDLTPDAKKFILFEDGGLRNAMANAMVKEGDYIEIVKLEPVALGGGRESNQYDIFGS